MRTPWWIVVLAAVLAAGVAAPAQAQVKIGVVGPLTGPVAVGGIQTKYGLEIALEEINGRGGIPRVGKVELLYEDDKCIPPESVAAVTKLVHRDDVVAVVGSVCSGATLANMAVTQRTETPHLVAVATSPAITARGHKFIFRTSVSDARAAEALADMVVNTLRLKEIGILHDADDYGRDGADVFQRRLEQGGVKPLGREAFNRGDKDFTGQLLKLRRAGSKALLIWGLPGEAALIAKQVRGLPWDATILGGDPLANPAYVSLAGPASEGTIAAIGFVAGHPDPKVQEFVKKYEARGYKEKISNVVAQAYDTLHLLAAALEKSGPTKARLRDALAATSHDGVTGRTAFDANGDGTRAPYIVQIKGGVPVLYGR